MTRIALTDTSLFNQASPAALTDSRFQILENGQQRLHTYVLGYGDSGASLPEQVELVSVPVNGQLYYDSNQNYRFDAGETVLAGDRLPGTAIGGVETTAPHLFYQAPADQVGAGLDRFQLRTHENNGGTNSATVVVDVTEKPLFSLNGERPGVDAESGVHLEHMPDTLITGLEFNDSAAVTGFDITLIHGFKPGDDLRLEGIEHMEVFSGVEVNYHFWEDKVQRIFLSSQDGAPVDHKVWQTLLDKLRLANETGALHNGERVVKFDPYYKDQQPNTVLDSAPLLKLSVEGGIESEPYHWIDRVGETDVSWTSSGARAVTSPGYEARPQVTVNIEPLTAAQLDGASNAVEDQAVFEFYPYPTTTEIRLPVGIGAQIESIPIAVSVPQVLEQELQGLIDRLVVDRPQEDTSQLLSQLTSLHQGLGEMILHSTKLEVDAALIEPEGQVTIDGTPIMLVDTTGLPADMELELSSNKGVTAVIGEGTINVSGSGSYVYAQSGSQTLTAQGSNNMLHGGAGDDQFIGMLQGNTLHGGLGHDLVTYSGQLADYQVTWGLGVVQIEAVSGSADTAYDKLINIEEIRFADQTLMQHETTEQAAISMLYNQTLGRQADHDGFQFWNERLDDHSMGSVVLGFLASEEYRARTGVEFDKLSLADQVEELYQGVLLRDSDAAGKAHWLGLLQSGVSMESVAEGFVYSAELIAQYQTSSSWDFSL